MISKRELFVRLCEAETDIDFIMLEMDKLERRIKKLEPKKVRKNEAKK